MQRNTCGGYPGPEHARVGINQPLERALGHPGYEQQLRQCADHHQEQHKDFPHMLAAKQALDNTAHARRQ